MPDIALVMLVGGTLIALGLVSVLQYARSLKRAEAIQERSSTQQSQADMIQQRSERQQETYDLQQSRAAALLDRHEALLSRAEVLLQRLESRDLS